MDTSSLWRRRTSWVAVRMVARRRKTNRPRSGVTATATSVKRQSSANITASMPRMVKLSMTRSSSEVDTKSCTASMSSVMVLMSGPT
jgi:hypothetical protein